MNDEMPDLVEGTNRRIQSLLKGEAPKYIKVKGKINGNFMLVEQLPKLVMNNRLIALMGCTLFAIAHVSLMYFLIVG